jgi:hypothetical protein
MYVTVVHFTSPEVLKAKERPFVDVGSIDFAKYLC